MFSYNTSIHEGTQYTPHELVYGKIARVPSSDAPVEGNLDQTYTDYLVSLFDQLEQTRTHARDNLIRAKQRSKRQYDRKAHSRNFAVGDSVYLLKEPTSGKLGDQYTGPHVILEKLGERNVRITLNNRRTKIVHENKLKLAPKEPGGDTTPTTSAARL